MSIPAYTPNYPPNGFTLGQTKTQLRNNLDGTFETLSVDHYNQNGANVGYHKQVHLINNSPSLGTANAALFSTVINGNSWPAWLNAAGGTSILSFITSRMQRGYASLPGSLLIQWGTDAVSSGTGTIKFPTTFATVLGFSPVVVLTGFTSSSSGLTNNIFLTGTLPASFSYNNFSSSIPTIYWIAIGPI